MELQKTETLSLVPADVSAGALQSALAGDLSKLREDERLKFYGALCNYTGLNPLAKPFDWLTFQGKLTLYANKGCAEQLRKLHGVSCDIIERKVEFGCLIVRVKATSADGRHDESLAALPFNEKNAEAAANAMMKCETKAKRRVTLSICGLSMMLEREEEKVEGAIQTDVIANVETAHDRADRLNATLTGGEKERAINVEVVPEKPKEVKVEVVPEEIEADPFAPDPEKPVVNGQVSEEEKHVREIELVLSENPQSIPYLIAQGKLLKVDNRINGVETLDKVYADRILKYPQKFLAAVDVWAKGRK